MKILKDSNWVSAFLIGDIKDITGQLCKELSADNLTGYSFNVCSFRLSADDKINISMRNRLRSLFSSASFCFEFCSFSYCFLIIVASSPFSWDYASWEQDMTGFLAKENGCFSVSYKEFETNFDMLNYRVQNLISFIKNRDGNEKNGFPGVVFLDGKNIESSIVSPFEFNRIIELFEAGKFDQLSIRIDSEVERIRNLLSEKTRITPPTSIKRFFVELITYIIHITYDCNIDVDRLLNYEDPYRVIFSMDETPSIKEWFMQTTKKLYNAIQSLRLSNKNESLPLVEKYIIDHISQKDLSISDVAEVFGMSYSYLSSLYSAFRGKSLVKFITETRIQEACHLLESTSLSVSDIADRVGFLSENNFYLSFKREIHDTPASYRKKHQ